MRSLTEFHGIFTPIVTPLNDDERPDLASLAAHVEWLLAAGVHGIWVLGTTGEFASFTAAERAEVVRAAVDAVMARRRHGGSQMQSPGSYCRAA